MKHRIRHTTTIIGLTVLLGCMALPSFVKLAHSLYGHQEIRCHSESRLHFHSAEFDCVFHKFNKTTVFIHHPLTIEIAIPELHFIQPLLAFRWEYTATPLPFCLRAPPLYS